MFKGWKFNTGGFAAIYDYCGTQGYVAIEKYQYKHYNKYGIHRPKSEVIWIEGGTLEDAIKHVEQYIVDHRSEILNSVKEKLVHRILTLEILEENIQKGLNGDEVD